MASIQASHGLPANKNHLSKPAQSKQEACILVYQHMRKYEEAVELSLEVRTATAVSGYQQREAASDRAEGSFRRVGATQVMKATY